ncbi:MAG: hypothetical protein BJ554DRAFT_7966 [Olpidium bornovanus]|uniref:Uncharacterized protein n=1 Tax=Olpidium bornovanus TaxID=278681 RepID=A0A8H7ZVQ2_9FUNG|nr:MAG: hypothetical protein BJ554DRAFT_7966 [Olpidium bornovanus]KAG5460037.1 MAG: hypothetical protein BJ554DRAFT_7966 [Olpidium bornovanus]
MAIGKFKHKRGGGRSFSSRCDDVEGADPFKGRKSPSSESASDSDSDSAESDGSDSDDVKNKPRFADNKAFGNTEEVRASLFIFFIAVRVRDVRSEPASHPHAHLRAEGEG